MRTHTQTQTQTHTHTHTTNREALSKIVEDCARTLRELLVSCTKVVLGLPDVAECQASIQLTTLCGDARAFAFSLWAASNLEKPDVQYQAGVDQ